MCTGVPTAQATTTWTGGAGTQWWFDPNNWDSGRIPPLSASGSVTDVQINLGMFTTIYDPTNDPNFPAAASEIFPPGYGPQIIDNLYISQNTTNGKRLSISGDLAFLNDVVVGQSSGMDGVVANGTIQQNSGIVSIPNDELDLAGPDTTHAGIGNGNYLYRGGTMDIGSMGGAGLRLSHGSNSTNGETGNPTGASGKGRFIMDNPTTGGYVRAKDVAVASYLGTPNATTDPWDPDGVKTGVGSFEFRYENGETRPFQVSDVLRINNGFDAATGGTVSSRLDLILNEPACNGAECVPNNIGLFDVDGSIQGSGDKGGIFSSADGLSEYNQGDMVSVKFGIVQYNWTISYTGDISWNDKDNSDVTSVVDNGSGTDVVLLGHSSAVVGNSGIPGDYNDDGVVSQGDLDLVLLNWGATSPPLPDGWVNGQPDGLIGGNELDGVLLNWGNPFAATSTIPEPSSIVMLFGFAGYGLLVSRPRKSVG